MASSIRLFVPNPLVPGAAITVSAGQAHYLAGVMRRGIGELVTLFNGRDGEFLAEIAQKTLGNEDAWTRIKELNKNVI